MLSSMITDDGAKLTITLCQGEFFFGDGMILGFIGSPW